MYALSMVIEHNQADYSIRGYLYGDKRLEKRGALIHESILKAETLVVNQLDANWSNKIGAYRFFNNPQVSESSILEQCLSLQSKIEDQGELKNPHRSDSLAWAAWIVARLGGWSGYQSQRPPGIITMEKGLEKFNPLFLGWSIRLP